MVYCLRSSQLLDTDEFLDFHLAFDRIEQSQTFLKEYFSRKED